MIHSDHERPGDEDLKPASPLRVPVTLLLAVTAPPLALAAWILLSGSARSEYFRSRWIRVGVVILALGALPLLAVVVAASLGLTRDPNPNPVGLGLLFFASGVVACLLVLIGIVRVALASRTG
jgi:hypothetical protein